MIPVLERSLVSSEDEKPLVWSSTQKKAERHPLVSVPSEESDFFNLLDIWFPDKKPLPTAFLVDTSEEALLLPDWLKLRMIRSEVSRLVDAGMSYNTVKYKLCKKQRCSDSK